MKHINEANDDNRRKVATDIYPWKKSAEPF
jgi:hypothetical protein